MTTTRDEDEQCGQNGRRRRKRRKIDLLQGIQRPIAAQPDARLIGESPPFKLNIKCDMIKIYLPIDLFSNLSNENCGSRKV